MQYNPHIRSLSWIPSYFVDPSTFSSQARGFMYRPLLLTSYAIDYAISGQSAAAFRCVNVLVHVAASAAFGALAFVFLRSAKGAMIASSLFLLHPAHSEVVNYISGRSDSLVAALYLLACVAILWRRHTSMVVGYGAALLVKSVAITMPAMLPMLRGWEPANPEAHGRRPSGARWAYALLGLASAGYVLFLWRSRFLSHSAEMFPRAMSLEIWTQLKALVYYVFLLAAPIRLSVDHAFQVGVVDDTTVLLCLAVILSCLVLSLRHRLTLPGLSAIWFGVCMLPYTVLPLNVLVAERRMYLASAGGLLLATWARQQLAARRGRRMSWIGIGLLVCCLVLTVQRNEAWSSSLSLWTDASRKNPASARSRVNLALAHRDQGDLDQARIQLEAGLRLDPGFAEGWVVTGDLARDAGEAQEARRAYERAVQIQPSMEGVFHNLGNLAITQGRLSGEITFYEEAITHYEEALRINPRFAEARNNLGQALEGVGEDESALAQYERAVADSTFWIHTDDPVGGAWYNLAMLADRLHLTAKAALAFQETVNHLSGEAQYAPFVNYAKQRLAQLRQRGSGS